MEVDGTVHEVIPRQLQLHPVKDTPVSLNFLRYRPDRPVDIPVEFIGQDGSPGTIKLSYDAKLAINRFLEQVSRKEVTSILLRVP